MLFHIKEDLINNLTLMNKCPVAAQIAKFAPRITCIQMNTWQKTWLSANIILVRKNTLILKILR